MMMRQLHVASHRDHQEVLSGAVKKLSTRLRRLHRPFLELQRLTDELHCTESLTATLPAAQSNEVSGTAEILALSWRWCSQHAFQANDNKSYQRKSFALRSGELWFELAFADSNELDTCSREILRVCESKYSSSIATAQRVDAVDLRALPTAIAAEMRLAQAQPFIDLLERTLENEFIASPLPQRDIDYSTSAGVPFTITLTSLHAGRIELKGWLKPLNTESLTRLHELAATRSPTDSRIQWASSLPLSLHWMIGIVGLPMHELKSLSLGDVVLLDRDGTGWAFALCLGADSRCQPPKTIGRGYLAAATQNVSVPSIADQTSHFSRANCVQWQQTYREVIPMSDIKLSDEPQSWLNSPNEIPISLRFTLPSQELTYERVRSLSLGSVIEFEQLVDGSCVSVYCGSKPIATGKLVAIGEHLGVQITALASDVRATLSVAQDAAEPHQLSVETDDQVKISDAFDSCQDEVGSTNAVQALNTPVAVIA